MFTITWFLCMIASVSIFVLGLRTISQEDKLLGPVREWLLSKKTVITMTGVANDQGSYTEKVTTQVPRFQEWWHKPLLTCVTCMPSLWGIIVVTIASQLFYDVQEVSMLKLIPSLIFICVSSSYITELFWSIKEKQKQY